MSELPCPATDVLNQMAQARKALGQQFNVAGVGEGVAVATALVDLAMKLAEAIKKARTKAQACELTLFWQRDGVTLEMQRLHKSWWSGKHKCFTLKLQDGRDYQPGAENSAEFRKQVLLSGMFYRLFVPMVTEHIVDPKYTKDDLIAHAKRYLEHCKSDMHINEFLSVRSAAHADKQLQNIKRKLKIKRMFSTYTLVLEVNGQNHR